MADQDARPSCFIAMPITTRSPEVYGGDAEHWRHVLDDLFVPAVEAAGYRAVRPIAQGSELIHDMIVQQLARADMVLCDLSDHNVNVGFELGIRTALDLPVTIVWDGLMNLPFDLNGMNAHQYSSELRSFDRDQQIAGLSKHLGEAREGSAGHNPMWQRFGVAARAEQPTSNLSPTDALLRVILDDVREVRLQTRPERVLEPVVDGYQPGFLRGVGQSHLEQLAAHVSHATGVDVHWSDVNYGTWDNGCWEVMISPWNEPLTSEQVDALYDYIWRPLNVTAPPARPYLRIILPPRALPGEIY